MVLWEEEQVKIFGAPRQEIRFDSQLCVGYNMNMSDEEIIKFYEELKEWYGDNLANFEHYPKIFANQVKLYRYYKKREENESGSL